MITENISDIVYIKSKETYTCRICNSSTEFFEVAINHMINEHGYKLKFIGTETESNYDQMPFHYTVAILTK